MVHEQEVLIYEEKESIEDRPKLFNAGDLQIEDYKIELENILNDGSGFNQSQAQSERNYVGEGGEGDFRMSEHQPYIHQEDQNPGLEKHYFQRVSAGTFTHNQLRESFPNDRSSEGLLGEGDQPKRTYTTESNNAHPNNDEMLLGDEDSSIIDPISSRLHQDQDSVSSKSQQQLSEHQMRNDEYQVILH